MNHLFLTSGLDSALTDIRTTIQGLRGTQPLAPARILLPTGRSTQYAQQQLGNTLNLTLQPFLRLAEDLLVAANRPVQRLDATARRHLIRHLLAQMADRNELTSFNAVHQKPGFVQALIEWLGEMKSQSIWPAQILAEADRTGQPRDRQLGTLYQRYQTFLHDNQLADSDGILWLAAEALEDNTIQLPTQPPLFVAGFDQFTPTQLRLLRALGYLTADLSVYLLWDAGRPGADLVLTRLSETRQALETALGVTGEWLEPAVSSGTLRFLAANLLRDQRQARPGGDPAGVRAVAAPSREDEIRWTLRDIKRRLLIGADADAIAMVAPNPTIYRRLVATIAREYALPIRVSEPLKLNPAVSSLLNLLQLYPDFNWRLTMESLRSPYIEQPWLDDAQLQLLEQLTRERPVVAGKEQWAFALRPLDLDLEERDDEDLGPVPLVAKTPAEELAAIESGLFTFFDITSPPRQATYATYVEWLENNILWANEEGDSLNVIGKAALEERTAERDEAALALVLGQLRHLLNATSLTEQAHKQISWETFRAALQELIPEAHGPEMEQDSGIFLGALEDTRSMQVDHLYVLGLSEGEFPRAPSPDIFYDPQEREQHPLPLVRYQPAESATLWWQLLNCPRQSLTLLRPRIDESGAVWVPSPYWDATVAILPNFPLTDLPLAPLPDATAAAAQHEWLNGLAVAPGSTIPAELTIGWQAAQRALALHELRESWLPAGPYEGMLTATDIQDELAYRFNERQPWSASRLNRYGTCPYGFFAQHILKLEEQVDPEEGFDAMQRGSLLHAILEILYLRLAEAGLTPGPDTEAQMLTWLEASCDQQFATAPLRYGFRESSLWQYEQQELRRLLRRLVQWECTGDGHSGHEPVYQELRFGFPGDDLPPLTLTVGDITFKLHGVVDRIDRDEAGDLHIIDYKSGRTRYSQKDVEEGRSLQVVLYRRAVEDLLPRQGDETVRVRSSRYLHLPNRESSGEPQRPAAVVAMNEKALEQAAHFVARVREGVFPSAPSKVNNSVTACRDNCTLAQICRVTRQSVSKWRR